MDIAESVALVTGANRGLGARSATEMLARGAQKFYATARNPASLSVEGAEVIALDLLDRASTEAAVEIAQDVTLLVNNAGISTGQNLIRGNEAEVRRELETNLFGTLAVTPWSLTAGIRVEFTPLNTDVLGLHLGGADTDMMAGYDGPLLDPTAVVRTELDRLEAGQVEVLVDDWSRTVKAGVAQEPAACYGQIAATLA